MTRHDLEKLLGGYAAGTLTPEERRALFDAALGDQTLFDALADEEALRDVLADPACRQRVQAALVEPPRTPFWLRKPAMWSLAAATAAAAVVLTVAVLRTKPTPHTASAPQQIAMANKPAPPESATAPQPAAERITRRVPRAAAESEQRAAEFPAAPALTAPRRELSAANEPSPPAGMGLGGKLDSAAPAATGAMAPAASVARAAQTAKANPTLPAAPASTDSVTVESKEISNLAMAGRDAAELMKVAPGMAVGKQGAFGLRYTLLRRGDGDKDVEVPPETDFGRSESVRLRIEAGQSGYLYVLAGKRALFAGPVVANQPVLIVTRPGVLNAVLLPQPDSGPLSTLATRARKDGIRLGQPGQPAPILAEISIKSR